MYSVEPRRARSFLSSILRTYNLDAAPIAYSNGQYKKMSHTGILQSSTNTIRTSSTHKILYNTERVLQCIFPPPARHNRCTLPSSQYKWLVVAAKAVLRARLFSERRSQHLCHIQLGPLCIAAVGFDVYLGDGCLPPDLLATE